MLTLGEPDRRLCNVNSETNEPLFFSQNRYDFQYRSIRMGNISYKSEFRQGIAYPHTIKSYIGVPDEFLQQIVRDFNATVTLYPHITSLISFFGLIH